MYGALLADTKIDQGTAYLVGTLLLAATLVIPSVNIVVKWIKGEPAPAAPPQPFVITSAKEFALAADLVALESKVEGRHLENIRKLDHIDEKLDRNLKAYIAAQTLEMKGMHDRLNRVAEGLSEIVGQMKHVVASSERSSQAAIIAAEAARGAIQAANETRRTGGHFSGGQG